MENNDKLIQKRQQVEHENPGFEDIWASGFDAKGTAAETPPPFELEASALEETSESLSHQILPSAESRNGNIPSIPTAGGQPLPEAVRISFEESLGIGLADVRIHNGASAQNAANDLQAEAFTHGLDIYFAGNGYIEGDPHSEKLLAHELLHVKQFKQGRVPSAKEQSVSSPQDTLETEAYAQETSIAKSSLEARGVDSSSAEFNGQSSAPTIEESTEKSESESEETIEKTVDSAVDSDGKVETAESNVEGNELDQSNSSFALGASDNIGQDSTDVVNDQKKEAIAPSLSGNDSTEDQVTPSEEIKDTDLDLSSSNTLSTFDVSGSPSTTEVSSLGTKALDNFHSKSKAIKVQLSASAKLAKTQISAAYDTQISTLQAKQAIQVESILAGRDAQKIALETFAQHEFQRFQEGKANQLQLSRLGAEEKKTAALAFGEAQATLAKNASEADAKQAFAFAASFQITGEPDAQQAKRKALNSIAQDAALKIRRNGNDVAGKARNLAIGFVKGIDDAYQQFREKLESETGAQESIALEIGAQIKGKIDQAAANAIQAVNQTASQGIQALRSEEVNALLAIDSRLSDLLANAATLSEQVEGTFTQHLSEAIAAVEDAESQGQSQQSEGLEEENAENSDSKDISSAVAQLAAAIQTWESTTLGEMDSFLTTTLSQLTELANSEANRSLLIGNDVAAQIDEGANAAICGMQELVGKVQGELSAATDEMLTGHAEAGTAFQSELDKQFSTGSAQLVQFVSDGLQGGQNLLSGLSGTMSGTLSEIDSEYARLKASANQQDAQISKRIMRSFWTWLDGVAQSVGTWFKETFGNWLGGLLFGVLEAMVISVVGCFAIGVLVVGLVVAGVSAAAIGVVVVVVGIVAGIGFGIYNRFQEYRAANGEGPGFWEGVGLVALGILDITGIPFIVEGIVGQRAFGAEMEDFERGERIGMGVFFFATMAASVVKGLRGPQVKAPRSQISEMTGGGRKVSGRGRMNGQRLRNKELKRLKHVLKKEHRLELQLVSESGETVIEGFFFKNGKPYMLHKNAVASFITDGINTKIVLRKNATLYEFFHEFMHFKHSKEAGLKTYWELGGKGTSGELIKEQFVFDHIVRNARSFTKDELSHALWYINDVRSRFGKDPINLDFSSAPELLPEQKTFSILIK